MNVQRAGLPPRADRAEAVAAMEAFLRRHPRTTALDCLFVDVTGTLRGKRVPVAELAGLLADGIQMSYSSFFVDAQGALTNAGGLGRADGDPDSAAFLDLGSLVPVAFADPPRAQGFVELRDPDGEPARVDPRSVLARVVARFRELGLTPVVAVELEFYLLDPHRTGEGLVQPPLCPRDGTREAAISVYGISDMDRYGRFMSGVREACALMGVPATTANAEYGPGQFEVNLKHRPDAVQAADQALLLKQCVAAAALREGTRATFMAKPYLENAGSGMHIHVSLADDQGRNVFDDGTGTGGEALRHAAGGLAALMPESMAVFAQNVNAFRRYVPNNFVPMSRRWGYNNRTIGIRVPPGPGPARRIEHRVAGANANPHLVVAAVLAGIHYGLAHRIDPGAPFAGDASALIDARLAFTMRDALAAMRAGRILPRYWGEFARLYVDSKTVELERFDGAITSREYDWYA